MQATAPIRGTQSFVGVMTAVWKRPALTGVELLWRITAFLPAWFLTTAFFGAPLTSFIPVNNNVAPPSPEQALHALQSFFTAIQSLTNPHTLLWLSAFALFWLVIATAGRSFILRKLDPTLRASYLKLFALNLARFALTAALIITWIATTTFAFHHFIWLPLANGGDANVILAFTIVVVTALALFVFNCLIAWTLQLAPIAAMQPTPTSKTTPELRSKLIEINLVMGIVKVCLLVLAMVFSACPLPFSNVETQQFLNFWWLGVFLLWVVASNLFHVVRAAAYLRLYDAYKNPAIETA